MKQICVQCGKRFESRTDISSFCSSLCEFNYSYLVIEEPKQAEELVNALEKAKKSTIKHTHSKE